MAGAGAAAEAAAGFPPSSAPAARRELFLAAGGGASPRWRQRRRRLRSAVPPGPGLGLLGLVFSRFCCTGASAVPGVQWHVQNLEALKWQSSAEGALAGPVVDPHVTAVWGKKVALKCIIDVNETITQVSWEKIYGKSSQTIAVHHPEYGISVQGEYQGRVAFKNYSLTDATIILKNVSFSDAGEYICKAVTFPLGNTQSSTTVTVLVEPVVSLTKGPNPLIDGANETVAATCTAATGKPAAQIDWEGDLGDKKTTSTPFPNETVTVVSQYVIIPTRFARGRHITCVVRHPALEKEIRYPYVLDIQYAPEVSVTGYDGNWFIGRGNVQLKCNADANPLPMEFMWTRLDGQWPEGLLSVNNTLQFSSPLTYNYTGTYICKVTNSLGQRSDQKTVYILDPPTTTTRLPTVPWHPSTDGITGLATQPRIIDFPTSTLPTMQDDSWGTIIGSVVGGLLLLSLLSILGAVLCYRRRKTFRGDYFAKSYIPPSDMQKESQIDVLQSDDVDSYPDSIKKEINHPMNIISKDYLEDPEKPELNNIDNTNRYQERYERRMDYYEGGTYGLSFMAGELYDDEDFVSHLDGAVISRREWYV
ncbi:nectin-3 isoform X1 [Corapipo altera]|uniref:nectin-3 isoform X1 n=1 Tax=Corapipo altera TaxID=415028 RepID=UPI000FD65EC0|nr:nectin-3 isoform X1 [Corapipo altera]